MKVEEGGPNAQKNLIYLKNSLQNKREIRF